MGDPDSFFFDSLMHTDCDLGVDEPMPRTPLVFREKTRWGVKHSDQDPIPADGNYFSANLYAAKVIEQVEEGVDSGRMMGPLSAPEAARVCGCPLMG